MNKYMSKYADENEDMVKLVNNVRNQAKLTICLLLSGSYKYVMSANIKFTVPSVLNQGNGEMSEHIVVDSLSDAFLKISELLGDDFKRKILDNDGVTPRHIINVYLNGKNIKFLDGMNTPLNQNDHVYILPAVSGG